MTKITNHKYLIFMDFDGVLTSGRVHFSHQDTSYPIWATFDPVAIEYFNKLHYMYDNVGFVWTTTWRNDIDLGSTMMYHIVTSMWYNAGFRGYLAKPWKVNPDDTLNHNNRADEVLHYIENYAPKCKDFLVFDDSNYNWNHKLPRKRWIRTDSQTGCWLILTNH